MRSYSENCLLETRKLIRNQKNIFCWSNQNFVESVKKFYQSNLKASLNLKALSIILKNMENMESLNFQKYYLMSHNVIIDNRIKKKNENLKAMVGNK